MMLTMSNPSSHSSACPSSSASCPACQVSDGWLAYTCSCLFSSSSFSFHPPLHRPHQTHRPKTQPQPVLHYLALFTIPKRSCTYPAVFQLFQFRIGSSLSPRAFEKRTHVEEDQRHQRKCWLNHAAEDELWNVLSNMTELVRLSYHPS